MQSKVIDAQLLAIKNEERPFIGVEVGETTQNIFLTNLGKTYAVSGQVWCLIRPTEEQIHWDDLYSPDVHHNVMYILPNHKDQTICPHVDKESAIDGTETVYGIVKYYDIDNHYYQTPFCINTIADRKTLKVVSQSMCTGQYSTFPPLI